MRCSLRGCYKTEVVGYVWDKTHDPDRVVMAPLCEADLRAAATIPDYYVTVFKEFRKPKGYA